MIANNNTPQMQVLKNINEKNKKLKEQKRYAPYVRESKNTKIQPVIKTKKTIDPKKMIFVTGSSIGDQQFKDIKNYKEPKKIKQDTPEMAKLKRMKKPRKRKLVVIKQTRSKQVQKSRPKVPPVAPESKKIHVL